MDCNIECLQLDNCLLLVDDNITLEWYTLQYFSLHYKFNCYTSYIYSLLTVNFYLCHDKQGGCHTQLEEVNNKQKIVI